MMLGLRQVSVVKQRGTASRVSPSPPCMLSSPAHHMGRHDTRFSARPARLLACSPCCRRRGLGRRG